MNQIFVKNVKITQKEEKKREEPEKKRKVMTERRQKEGPQFPLREKNLPRKPGGRAAGQ